MRKLTLEMEIDEMGIKMLKPMFDVLESYEIIDKLKIDFEEGICVDLIECNLKEGLSINNMKNFGQYEILNVLKSQGNKHTCLVKYYESEDSMDSFKEFDLDLIPTTPTIISKKKVTYSCIGAQENLIKLIDLIKRHGNKIVNMTFKRAVYEKADILSVLTDKQRETLIAAHKHGYYKFPKKINSEELSKKVNIGKTTMIQHLRKAEGRILDEILTGYS